MERTNTSRKAVQYEGTYITISEILYFMQYFLIPCSFIRLPSLNVSNDPNGTNVASMGY